MAERRRHSTTHSEGLGDDYSDDFSDDDESTAKSAPDKGHPRQPKARGRGRGRGKGRGHGRHGQARPNVQLDEVTKRLLSANYLRMKELQNEMEDVKKQLEAVSDENKVFKRLQRKQERALTKFEDTESQLPQMIRKHNNEVRALKEQLRQAREKYDRTDRYLHDAEDELEKASSQMKKYRALTEKKNLGERSDLDRRLNNVELTLEEKTSRITELERHVELVKKNHRHELGIERARCKEALRQIDEIREEKAKLELQVREKEKLLEAKNIYSNRMLKPSSYSGTPAHTPPPWRQNMLKKSGSLTDLTPRDKAKAYEEKRRAEAAKRAKRAKSQEPKKKWIEPAEDDKKNTTDNSHTPKQDDEDEFWRRQQELYKQEQISKQQQEEERRRQQEEEEREQARLREQREKMQREQEEKERAERQKREAEERERKERERKEEMERNEREREQREREEREAKQREKERQEQEERERQENEAKQAEERRKKEELLRRLQNMDGASAQPSHDPFAPSDSTRGKGVDSAAASPTRRASRADSTNPAHSTRKDYNFTQTVENMHKGKPAHDDVHVPYTDRQKRIKAGATEDDVGGYQPSFSGPIKPTANKPKKPLSLFDSSESKPANKPAETDKKSKLMADLFGSQETSKKSDKDDLLFGDKPASKPTQNKRQSGFPWDDSSSSTKMNGADKRESSALFGGGAAVIDDSNERFGDSNSSLLPRRQRQTATTFTSKPAVMAVGNFDDDIEEVVL